MGEDAGLCSGHRLLARRPELPRLQGRLNFKGGTDVLRWLRPARVDGVCYFA
jgi:hypothetical protein